MDIKLLEDFVCLANLESFTAASRERHVTQSALSRRIKALEDWLGTELINRESNSFGLTPQGTIFVSEAQTILRRLYNAREAARTLGMNGDCEITVAAQNSIAQTLFLDWLKRLEKKLDNVYVRLVSEKLSDCLELLNQGHVNYMFCYANPALNLPIDNNKFAFTTVGKERLIPVSLCNSTQQPSFTLPGSVSAPVPYVAYSHESLFGKAIDQLIQNKQHHCFLSRRYENAFSHTLKSMVLENLGVAWLPQSSILNDLSEGRLCRAGDSHWDIEFDIRLYYHRETNGDSRREKAVLETSIEMAEELMR